ncbi:MAG: TldD/PmbA family protein [Nitrospirota bacterium]|nr:TldD/PmbA family protein [Nitrospirota bacterium]
MPQTALSLQDLAEKMVERAVALGATGADALAVESDAFSVQVRLGEVETTTGARDKGISLRVFHGTRSAACSSSDFSPEAIERLVVDTCELARLTEEDPDAGLPPDPATPPGVALDLYDDGITLSIDERVDLARRAEAVAMAADPRISNSEGASFDSSSSERAYVRSTGFSGSYRTTSYGLSTVPVASHDGGMQRDWWFTGARHFADLLSPEEVGAEAARRVLRRLGAKKGRTCKVPVVFDPLAAASLIGHLAGAVSGDSVYKGASFLGEKLGRKIAASGVTIIDDGLRPRGLGSKPFDGEGMPVGRHTVVEAGVLNTFLLDTYTAKKLGKSSTGHASRGLGGSPSPSATNFYLQAGSATPEEIIGSVQNGLYVTELIGFGVNGVTGDYSRGASGIWIENGELTWPVEEVTISSNLLDMFAGIEMIGNDLDFSRRVVSPTVKIDRMTVGGD